MAWPHQPTGSIHRAGALLLAPAATIGIFLCAAAPPALAGPRLQPGEEQPPPAFAMPTMHGPVLDLCTLGETSDGTRSVKQRGVLLGPAGLERFDADPALAAIGASVHARETFVARFPLDRLYGVVTSLPGQPSWLQRKSIPLSEVADALSRVPLERPFAGEDEGGGARERAFVRYSLSCTDWVFVPVLDHVGVRWRWQMAELRSVGATASSNGASAGAEVTQREMYLPDIKVAMRIGVFRRQGDALQLKQVVHGGTDKNTGMPDLPPPVEGAEIPPYISAIPDATCAVPETATDGTPGLGCPPEALGSASQAMLFLGKNEHDSRVCQARNMWNPGVWALCTLRMAMETATGGAQKNTRKVPGLLLFDRLQQGNVKDARGPGIAIGRHEGVKVGYGFFTQGQNGKMKSFLRVTHVGPGGRDGDAHRTALRSRFGKAAFGETVYEYPQSNLYLGVTLGGGPLLGMAGPTTFTRGSLAGRTATFPSWTGGLSLSFMWDYSALSGLPESRTGIEAHLLTGVTSSVSVLTIPVDFPKLEQGFYLGPRTKIFASLAFSAGWLFVALADQVQVTGIGGVFSAQALRGYLIGAAASVGVEYMSTPDRLWRLDIAARSYGRARLGTDLDTSELDQRGDSYASIMARLIYDFAL